MWRPGKGGAWATCAPTFEPILWFVKPHPIGTTITDNVLARRVGALSEIAFVSYKRKPDNVLRSGFGKGEGWLHVVQKPVTLLRAMIELTTSKGQNVLDPFCGKSDPKSASVAPRPAANLGTLVCIPCVRQAGGWPEDSGDNVCHCSVL